MDTTQFILLTIAIVLAVFLIAIGFQAFFVLKDLRKTLYRTNRLLDNADEMLDQVRRPVESVSNFMTALTTGAGIAQIFKKFKDDKKK